MKNLKHKRLNTFEPKIACYMQVSLRVHSGTIISTFLTKLPAGFTTTGIFVNVNYISLRLCEYTQFTILFFFKIQSTYIQNSAYGFPNSSQMSFIDNF